MKTRTVQGIEITTDKIVAKLIDRLLATETRLEAQQREIEDLREQLAESCAWLVPGVGLRFSRVLETDVDDSAEHTITIPESAFAEHVSRQV